MTRKIAIEVLENALKAVAFDREAMHGSIEENFGMIAELWSTYLGIHISSEEVAWMMVLVKVSRAKCGNGHQDHAVDAAGYAAIAEALREPTVEQMQTEFCTEP